MSGSRAIEIRRAGAGDAPAVARLLCDFNAEYQEPAPRPEQLARRIIELLDGGDTGILVGGEPPCALVLMRFRPGLWSRALECTLAELYVVPGRRGQGIGRALMERAIELARERGAGTMELGTGEADVVARALYESLGFDNHEHGPGGVETLSYFYYKDL
ncbi:MAG TPA: GNAT family N-acetyltransferase [Solirubrobacteraceae bacterium]|jgi:GNAT superfamily N-acetyltransferase|nr:GNAT family N-acetyltransferase [Solirubrobacteraceae bacterium]